MSLCGYWSSDLCYCELWYFSFFFFQAEDGIRDLTVTGVQTCALPIWFKPHDGGLPVEWFEPQCRQLRAEITRVFVQRADQLGVLLDVADGGERAPSEGGGERVAEQRGPGALGEVVGEGRGPGGESSRRPTQRLAQGRRDDVHLARHSEMLGRAPARLPQHAGGVRLVDGHDGVVLPRARRDGRQLRDVAFHREDAVREDQPEAVVLRRLESLLQVRHVRVPVHRGLALRDGLGEPDRVDDGGGIQRVGDDDVLLPQQRGTETLVCVPAAAVCE